MAKKKEEVDYDALAKEIAEIQATLKGTEEKQAQLLAAQKKYKGKIVGEVRKTIGEYGITLWELRGAFAASDYEKNMLEAYNAWKAQQPAKKTKKKDADEKKF